MVTCTVIATRENISFPTVIYRKDSRYTTDKSGRISQEQLYKMVKDFADEVGSPSEHCKDCVRYILALFNADDNATLDIFVSQAVSRLD